MYLEQFLHCKTINYIQCIRMIVVDYTFSGSLKCVQEFLLSGWHAPWGAPRAQPALCPHHASHPVTAVRQERLFLLTLGFVIVVLPALQSCPRFPVLFPWLWPKADLTWEGYIAFRCLSFDFPHLTGPALVLVWPPPSSYLCHPTFQNVSISFYPGISAPPSVAKCLFHFSLQKVGSNPEALSPTPVFFRP